MTNEEKYRMWWRNAMCLDARYMAGNISLDELDRLDGNMRERLGMDKWT